MPILVRALMVMLGTGVSVAAGAQTLHLAPLAVALLAQQNRPSVMGALANKGMVRPASATQPARVTALVRFSAAMPDVTAIGGRVLWESGDVAGVEVPIAELQNLAQLASVRYVDVAVPLKPQLDLAVAATGANEVRSGTPPDWSGDTGRNVLIGFIDTGIDLSHLDFRNPQGGSRVVELIDYTTGTRCSGAQIDAGECAEVDTEGHGTEVAGIAAGNGSATGNGQPTYRYVGMAPQAGLLVAKGDWTTANIVTAVQDLESVADSLGRPLVINLSLGTEIGPHDGTDNVDRALDNASGPGRILVIAAGNHADDDSHASGSVPNGGSVAIGAQVPVATDLTAFDIWYAGADRMAIDVSNGSSCDSGTIAAPVSDTPAESAFCAGRATVVSGGVNPLNGDREILITLTATADAPFVSSGWQITLTGTAISNGRFDAWTNGSTSGANFTSNLDPVDTLSDLATASAPIAVVSYNTRNTWVSLDGTMSAITSNPLGAISYFSSAGPRRSCSLTLECPAVQKPDITAPGAWIAAAYSAQTVWPSGTCVDCYLDLDGVHSFRQGTSMAAPIVSGGVALLLQLAPQATPGQIKAYLDQYAATDDFVGAVPNDRWGYGKLDIKSAFDALPVAPPAAPTGVTAAPSGTSAILAWAANTAIDVDGYAIDRASVASGPYTQVGTVSYRGTTYTDSGLSSGTYYYTVRTLDTKGQESLPSSSVSAAVTATSSPTTVSTSSSGGGGCVFMPGEPFDPVLLGLVTLGAIGQGVRAGRRHSQKRCRRPEEES
jgi:subtilisin family serine protease